MIDVNPKNSVSDIARSRMTGLRESLEKKGLLSRAALWVLAGKLLDPEEVPFDERHDLAIVGALWGQHGLTNETRDAPLAEDGTADSIDCDPEARRLFLEALPEGYLPSIGHVASFFGRTIELRKKHPELLKTLCAMSQADILPLGHFLMLRDRGLTEENERKVLKCFRWLAEASVVKDKKGGIVLRNPFPRGTELHNLVAAILQ